MKPKINYSALIIVALVAFWSCDTKNSGAAEWKLSWEDNFDGKTF